MGPPADNEQATISGYRAVHLIAHSYLGSLSIALDQRNGVPGKPVLLRRLQRSELTPSEALQRMACAGRDAMALSHENVLPVLAVVLQDDALALVYEYVEAEPLRSLQSWATHRGLAIPVGVSLRMVTDLLRGVRALHGSLLGWPSAPPFGGLSPDSVLVSRDGRTRLCDPLLASCATLLEGLNLNASKLAYTAPEQAYATAPLAAASDVFSCAIMLWELLAGCRLFTGARPAVERKLLEHDVPSLRAQRPVESQLSERLVQLVERSLAADAGRRPQSPAQLLSELEDCGHEVASPGEVATFVGDLAGVAFDQRRMTVRSLPSLRMPSASGSGASSGNRRVPLPAHVSAGGGSFRSPLASPSLSAANAPALSGAARERPLIALPERGSGARWAAAELAPLLAGLAPDVVRDERPALLPPREPAVESFSEWPADAAVEPFAPVPLEPAVPAPALSPAEPFAPARAEPFAPAPPEPPVPALVQSVADEPAPSASAYRAQPVGSTTMVGWAMPPSIGDQRPPDGVLPDAAPSSQALLEIPSDSAPSASSSRALPEPIPSLVPTLRPSLHGLGAAFADSQREQLEREADSELARPSGWSQPPESKRQPRTRVALAGVFGTLALSAVLSTTLWLRSSAPDSNFSRAQTRAAAPGSQRASAVPAPPAPALLRPTAARSAAVPARDGGAAAATTPPDAAQLGDDELLQLFALERRAQLPSCSERLGANLRSYTGASPDKSQAALKAARRELLRGNNARALELLCGATLHDGLNVAAWQALATLALHLGDGVRAAEAIEQALKRKPGDPGLLATEGDIEALHGHLEQSRTLWAKGSSGSALEPGSERRLAQQFASVGARKLREGSYGAALVQYRRAVVLSRGAPGPGTGLSAALRLLGQPEAALAWADRVAPPDDR